MTPRELAILADVTPNMIYTYMRTGRIAYVTLDDGSYAIEGAYGAHWACEHIRKRNIRRERQQALLEAQLGGL